MDRNCKVFCNPLQRKGHCILKYSATEDKVWRVKVLGEAYLTICYYCILCPDGTLVAKHAQVLSILGSSNSLTAQKSAALACSYSNRDGLLALWRSALEFLPGIVLSGLKDIQLSVLYD